MSKIVHCHNCVFLDDGDSGYGASCNMHNDEIFNNRPRYDAYKKEQMICRDFRTYDQMRIMLDKDNELV